MAAVARDQRVHTPDGSRETTAMKISESQRQALVDNLQLEITERARKLRAQYALQAQGLRARLEMRINRIPTSLRKRTMQELMDEHNQQSKPIAPQPLPVATTKREQPKAVVNRQISGKRTSEHFEEDKENDHGRGAPTGLENPKKRTKTTQATAKTTRPTTAQSNGVLSPKSHNSRTLPQSPFKTATTLEKSGPPRPASPIKAFQKALGKTSRPPVTRQPTKRQAKDDSRPSVASDTSNATTIIKRTNSKKAPSKAASTKTAPASRKTATTKKETATATTTTTTTSTTTSSGRTLRKRG